MFAYPYDLREIVAFDSIREESGQEPFWFKMEYTRTRGEFRDMEIDDYKIESNMMKAVYGQILLLQPLMNVDKSMLAKSDMIVDNTLRLFKTLPPLPTSEDKMIISKDKRLDAIIPTQEILMRCYEKNYATSGSAFDKMVVFATSRFESLPPDRKRFLRFQFMRSLLYESAYNYVIESALGPDHGSRYPISVLLIRLIDHPRKIDTWTSKCCGNKLCVNEAVMKCASCPTYYCSKECQKMDWTGSHYSAKSINHKAVCLKGPTQTFHKAFNSLKSTLGPFLNGAAKSVEEKNETIDNIHTIMDLIEKHAQLTPEMEEQKKIVKRYLASL